MHQLELLQCALLSLIASYVVPGQWFKIMAWLMTITFSVIGCLHFALSFY